MFIFDIIMHLTSLFFIELQINGGKSVANFDKNLCSMSKITPVPFEFTKIPRITLNFKLKSFTITTLSLVISHGKPISLIKSCCNVEDRSWLPLSDN